MPLVTSPHRMGRLTSATSHLLLPKQAWLHTQAVTEGRQQSLCSPAPETVVWGVGESGGQTLVPAPPSRQGLHSMWGKSLQRWLPTSIVQLCQVAISLTSPPHQPTYGAARVGLGWGRSISFLLPIPPWL